MDLDIISPYTHLNGHYWPYTADFVQAMTAGAHELRVFASRRPRHLPASWNTCSEWNACCPWSRLLPGGYRARHWGGRADSLARNLEFLLCMRAAQCKRDASAAACHIHCIESRHRILLKEVLSSSQTFSTLCVGEPPEGMGAAREKAYRKAFATGRLSFIVETEAVRKSWEHLAGDHVLHIPAALPASRHEPVNQAQARESLGLPPEACIFLFFGTHREGKDYQTAIQAAKTSTSKPYLLFVGPLISGNDPAVLLDSTGYRYAQSWNHYFPDEKVPALFDACDAVMLPYAENYQKGSAVLLQACHYRKPVIATRTGHLQQFVELNNNGILFAAGSATELASCYDRIAAMRNSDSHTHPWSFDTAVANYSWQNLLPRYLEIFKNSK